MCGGNKRGSDADQRLDLRRYKRIRLEGKAGADTLGSNLRIALGVLAAVSFFTALIALIQIGFRALGWVRQRSEWMVPDLDSILIVSLLLFAVSVLLL